MSGGAAHPSPDGSALAPVTPRHRPTTEAAVPGHAVYPLLLWATISTNSRRTSLRLPAIA